jgi:uncharacterized protein (DUF305 family)
MAVATATALTLAGVLAGCSSNDMPGMPGMSGMHGMSSSPAAGDADSSTHNAQDVAFAQMMIVHHKGAIEMADLAETKATMPDVQKLAASIKSAQQPEIDEMTGWLNVWGEPVTMPGMSGSMPSASPSDGGASDPMATSMPGMTPQDMHSLQNASGMDFDRQFLTLMVQHHQGAIDMANTEVKSGKSPQATALAKSIIDSQSKEIQQMNSILQGMS